MNQSKWEWHNWFAWYPVTRSSGSIDDLGEIVWLKRIQRKRKKLFTGIAYAEWWSYRYINKELG